MNDKPSGDVLHEICSIRYIYSLELLCKQHDIACLCYHKL